MAAARSRSLSLTWLSSSRFCAAPGSMPSRLPIGPSLRTIASCSTKSSSVKPSPEASLPGHLGGLVLVEGPLGLLDQGEDVAEVEDAGRHPVGVEDVEVLELLAGRGEHDGPAGELPRSTARRRRGRRRPAWSARRRRSRRRRGTPGRWSPRPGRSSRRRRTGSRPGRRRRGCRPPAASSPASMPRRPAVSMMTMLCSGAWPRPASRGPPRPGRRRRCRAAARTPGRRPARRRTWSCWTALGRCRSAATSSGVLPCSRSQRASLAASVVLPEPCRPASMITVGGVLANRSRRVSPPRIAISSSLTILMTCWAGLSACGDLARRAPAP